jgi:anti-sigma-28 factor FlgM
MEILDDRGTTRSPDQPDRRGNPTCQLRGNEAGVLKRPWGYRSEPSELARTLRLATDAVTQLQGIRAEKINSLKRRIQNGTYYVPGERIAERMLLKGFLV